MTDEELLIWLRVEDTNLTDFAAARIEELLAERKKDHANINLKADFIDKTINQLAEADAKLAKAVEALDEAVYLLDPDEKDMMRQAGVYRIVTTLAEIKGESHE